MLGFPVKTDGLTDRLEGDVGSAVDEGCAKGSSVKLHGHERERISHDGLLWVQSMCDCNPNANPGGSQDKLAYQ